MITYLPLYVLLAFMLFVMVFSIYTIYSSAKLLPDNVKYKYKLIIRAKAMFISATRYKENIEEKDIDFFIAYNKSYKSYLLKLIVSFIVFITIYTASLYLIV